MNAIANDMPPDDIEHLFDHTGDGIDWDELIAELPEDIESEPYAFSTADYATPEEGLAALRALLATLGNGDPNEESRISDPDTARA